MWCSFRFRAGERLLTFELVLTLGVCVIISYLILYYPLLSYSILLIHLLFFSFQSSLLFLFQIFPPIPILFILLSSVPSFSTFLSATPPILSPHPSLSFSQYSFYTCRLLDPLIYILFSSSPPKLTPHVLSEWMVEV